MGQIMFEQIATGNVVMYALRHSVVITGAIGILAALVCLFLLRKHRVSVEKICAGLRSAQQDHQIESAARLEQTMQQIGCRLAVLELGAANADEAGKGGLTRSVRAKAMQLLRTGMSPDNAASTLGIARREMRLIARVSRILYLP